MLPLQAEYGVSTEYPAGSVTAFQAAVEQQYDSIFVDLEVRNGGIFAKAPDKAKYDRPKFAGIAPASLGEILTFAQDTGCGVRFGSAFENFTAEEQDAFFRMIENAPVTLTASTPNSLRYLQTRFPAMDLHYDGPVTDALLREFPGVTFWLDMNRYTPEELTALAKQITAYGKLGLSSVRDDPQSELGAAILATPGQVKPVQKQGFLSDMHTHSQNSMDADVPILDLAKAEIEAGAKMVAITDHIEMQWVETWPEYDFDKCLTDCAKEIEQAQKELGDAIEITFGMELGQAAWHPEEANRLIHLLPLDIVVGCVHEIIDPTETDRLASITPWQKLFKPEFAEKTDLFMKQYFAEMLTMVNTVDMDTLAHMTFVARAGQAKFNKIIDLKPYEADIRQILQVLIDKGIALEINCSWYLKRGFYDPQEWIVELYRQMGGYLITLGSDSHDAPDAPLSGFREIADRMKTLGFQNIFYFKNRRSYPCTI